MPPIKLLMVDDDEDDVLIIRALLDDIGRHRFQLDYATDFADGEAQLKSNTHDLCLMDYRLGARDGIELLKRAKALSFTGPIIFLSGIHVNEVDNRALRAGAADFLTKENLTAQTLERAIRYALGRKEVEMARMEQLKAEAQSRAKSEFLAYLSHELRSPLSAILGFTELLLAQVYSAQSIDSSELSDRLRIIDRNGKHLLGLFNDMLDLSRLDVGQLALEKQPIELAAFLADIYALGHSQAAEKNLTFHLEPPNMVPLTIVSDPMRLRQVLLNLIGNAVKFTDRGGVRLSVDWIDNADHCLLQFSVKDTGMGIAPADRERVFLPFFRSTQGRVQPRAGAGLGLAISKHLVTFLGGDLWLQSRMGQGSEFTFSINPGNIDSSRLQALTFDGELDATTEKVVVPRFSGSVLIVDDLRDIRQLIGQFIETTGLDVVYAKNGREALQAVAQAEQRGRHFAVVLMDIHMPVMGGLDATVNLRQTGFSSPIVALTAGHIKGDNDSLREAGFSDYLSKPVTRARLYHCLATHLARLSEGETRSEPKARQTMQVLVVDDDGDAAQVLAEWLTRLGHRATIANSASAALAIAGAEKIDLALVDLHLGEDDGYQLCAQLTALDSAIRIVVISGAEVDFSKAAAMGVERSVLKPITAEVLTSILSEVDFNTPS
ncbi:response regulator [Exilibacterium tricleocarpae]|uniref:histidine kinase n=1 Tax=Exilibacterium tricleocarpae TaxID=2591008 RepID=A0A545SMS8_9GAMM|nr:response regulator [Exilibacterium tricleocarpae]TQV66312.1 response regulator [Exilibacterium tricleocarpae]